MGITSSLQDFCYCTIERATKTTCLRHFAGTIKMQLKESLGKIEIHYKSHSDAVMVEKYK